MNKNTQSLYVPPLGLRLLLILCALTVVSQLYVPLPILPQLAHTLHVTTGAATGVISAFGLAYAVGFLIFGPLSDRLGRRRVMVWGLFALALISSVIAWTDSAPLLMAGRALQGLAAAAFPPVVIAYLAECGTVRQRTWGVAWVSTAFLSAGLLGQIYGGTVANRWGLGMAMLPLALIYVCTATALLMTSADRHQSSAQSAWFSGYRSLGRLLSDVQLRRVYASALLLLMCFVVFYLALDTHAGTALRTHGITPLMVRGIALPAFLAPLVVASVISRFGAQCMVTVGLSMACVGLVSVRLGGC